jgi:hypothetical protein
MISVVTPVGTSFPKIGHVIIISAIGWSLAEKEKPRDVPAGQTALNEGEGLGGRGPSKQPTRPFNFRSCGHCAAVKMKSPGRGPGQVIPPAFVAPGRRLLRSPGESSSIARRARRSTNGTALYDPSSTKSVVLRTLAARR